MLAKPNHIIITVPLALVLLFSAVAAHYPGASDLDINLNDYEALCGKDSDPKHPCFTHWWLGLDRAVVKFDNKDIDVRKEVKVKDDQWTDFGMKDASEPFSLTYLDTNTAQVFYSNYNPVDGCYDIEVSIATYVRGWRVWVSDEIGDDRDLDTQNGVSSKTRFCTKWLHIHVKPDGRGHPSGY